jgi:membrane fusion protein (multidrug efflux system)
MPILTENEEQVATPAAETHAEPRRVWDRMVHGKYGRLPLIGGVVLIALLCAGFYYYSGRVSTDDAQVDGDLTPISSKVFGQVAQVLIQDNQQVEAGQTLVVIDPRDYQARVDQARAALATAEAQDTAARASIPLTSETTASATTASSALIKSKEAEVERATASYDQAVNAGLAVARAKVEARQADFNKAHADLQRMAPLVSKDEISKQEFDSFTAAERVASSNLSAANDQLAAATKEVDIRRAALLNAQAELGQARAQWLESRAGEKQVPVTTARAASAHAAVQKAKADLEAAQLQLSYCRIVAPLREVITRKTVEPGEIVQPGQQFFILVPLDSVWVTADFKEDQLAGVHPGQKAEISVDMYGKTLTGHVDSIAGATGARTSLLPPENATGNFVKVVQRIPVKILVDRNSKYILRPGMNVDATVITR